MNRVERCLRRQADSPAGQVWLLYSSAGLVDGTERNGRTVLALSEYRSYLAATR
jgi:hypothetical protein